MLGDGVGDALGDVLAEVVLLVLRAELLETRRFLQTQHELG
jgi:hypothetical protein